MEEKALQSKRSGFLMLLMCIVIFISGALVFVYGVMHLERGETNLGGFMVTVSILGYLAGFIALAGFKVLKPQEALVLTLFGNYIGTLREPGFYWVCPFCTAVNPAAGTKLSQSGDVDGAAKTISSAQSTSKKISLKQMTLNPPEDQRLSGQPGGDRHCSHLAGDGHRQGRL